VLQLFVTADVVPSPLIPFNLMGVIRYSETTVFTRATRRRIPEDCILHSHCLEGLRALSGWAMRRRRHLSPVRYETDFYIPEDGILHSHRRENLKSYNTDRLGSEAET
jgi:hypothetical protein